MGLWCGGGWQKLTALPGKAAEPIADSPTHQLKNQPSSKSLKFPTKSAKIFIPITQILYRTTYRQNPLKSNISTTSQPKNQTSISPKIYTQI